MVKQILHIILAFTLFIATMGVSVRSHYCMGNLKFKTLSIWKAPCCKSPTDMPMDCCKDRFDHYQVDDDFQSSLTMGVFSPQLEISFPVNVEPLNYPEENQTPHFYLNYKPPLIERDVPVLVQSFLI